MVLSTRILNSLAQSQSIREAIALSLEQLVGDEEELASVKARALSALATATKITQEVQRKALKEAKENLVFAKSESDYENSLADFLIELSP